MKEVNSEGPNGSILMTGSIGFWIAAARVRVGPRGGSTQREKLPGGDRTVWYPDCTGGYRIYACVQVCKTEYHEKKAILQKIINKIIQALPNNLAIPTQVSTHEKLKRLSK